VFWCILALRHQQKEKKKLSLARDGSRRFGSRHFGLIPRKGKAFFFGSRRFGSRRFGLIARKGKAFFLSLIFL
jgi:hypothetical protein